MCRFKQSSSPSKTKPSVRLSCGQTRPKAWACLTPVQLLASFGCRKRFSPAVEAAYGIPDGKDGREEVEEKMYVNKNMNVNPLRKTCTCPSTNPSTEPFSVVTIGPAQVAPTKRYRPRSMANIAPLYTPHQEDDCGSPGPRLKKENSPL